MLEGNYIKPQPAGADLLKTGQTTSYATGDDGDTELGREVDFFTIQKNNPFGNGDRFTDELGGQTYTNGIVIDWSTYNGSTVVGYHRTPVVDKSWATALSECASFSAGSYSSGWRLPNIRELFSLYYFGQFPSLLNYAPFSISYTGYFWSSTSISSSVSYIAYPFQALISSDTNSNSSGRGYIPCRTFTVSGTTLT